MSSEVKSTTRIATLAIAIAIVTVFTMVVKIPTPGGGYLNCSDVAITFFAFLLSPTSSLLASGLGACLADAISGYAQWVPITFVAHGLEGLFVALIVKEKDREFSKKERVIRKLLAVLTSTISVALFYFLLSSTFLYGYATALVEVPGNLIQAGVGSVLGFVLSEAVKKAYPPVSKLK